MDKNQKIAVAVIAIIAIVAAWQLGKSPVNEPSQNQEQIEQENGSEANEQEEENNNTSTKSPEQSTENMWEGKLEASDNTAKGNYKLISGTHVIYIKTSRDYSALVGKDVKVNYKGSLESFSLEDITAK